MGRHPKTRPPAGYAFRDFFNPNMVRRVVISTPTVGRPPKRKAEDQAVSQGADNQGADAPDNAPSQGDQPPAPASPSPAADVIVIEDAALANEGETGQASPRDLPVEGETSAAEVVQKPESAEAPSTSGSSGAKRKRVKRDDDLPWMRWFEPTVAGVNKKNEPVSRGKCIACSEPGKDCILTNNLDTLQKHVGIKVQLDGSVINVGKNNQHDLNVRRFVELAQRKELGALYHL